ncbi:hypothetical protein BgiMline_006129 [Biomphalaria glabrata]|nr:hypothetical protein BgiMline_004092 [Biomphalaria glabrata]
MLRSDAYMLQSTNRADSWASKCTIVILPGHPNVPLSFFLGIQMYHCHSSWASKCTIVILPGHPNVPLSFFLGIQMYHCHSSWASKCTIVILPGHPNVPLSFFLGMQMYHCHSSWASKCTIVILPTLASSNETFGLSLGSNSVEHIGQKENQSWYSKFTPEGGVINCEKNIAKFRVLKQDYRSFDRKKLNLGF